MLTNLCATTETRGSQKKKKKSHWPKQSRGQNQNQGMENYRIWEEWKSLTKMDLDTGNGAELGPLMLQSTQEASDSLDQMMGKPKSSSLSPAKH